MNDCQIEINNCKLVLCQGDITREKTAAIVNAANSSLMGGGGVDGAIHRAGGPSIKQECKEIVSLHGRLAPGKAVITGSGNLEADYVIHTVGPIWRNGTGNEDQVLESAYQSCLELAKQYELQSIAFPSISTGAFGFPLDRASAIALKTVKTFAAHNSLPSLIKFVLFDPFTYQSYKQALD